MALGQFDEPTFWKNGKEQPHLCGGCPVKAHCHRTAWERIEAGPRLARLYHAWEVATQGLLRLDRYKHPTWAAFVAACEDQRWPDSNVEALARDEEQRAKDRTRRKANAAAKRRARKKMAKQIPPDLVRKISDYRDDRELDLKVAWLGPKPPLWIRNLTVERCVLVADAWQGSELLRRANLRSSGKQVAEWLKENGRQPGDAGNRWVKNVEEALRLADRLIEDGDWPELESKPAAPSQAGKGMHSAVITEVLDD
jgi:hypothetical protein